MQKRGTRVIRGLLKKCTAFGRLTLDLGLTARSNPLGSVNRSRQRGWGLPEKSCGQTRRNVTFDAKKRPQDACKRLFCQGKSKLAQARNSSMATQLTCTARSWARWASNRNAVL